MKSIIKKLLCLLVLTISIFSFTSCLIIFNIPSEDGDLGGGLEGDEGSSGGVDFPGQEESVTPGEWGGVSSSSDVISLRIMRGESENLNEYIDKSYDTEGLEWSSRCESIAKVENGVVSGVNAGRTLVGASLFGEEVASFSVTVEFTVSANSGFNIVSDATDGVTYSASSLYEANRILDRAIAARMSKVKIDFSPLSENFSIKTDFDLDSEFGNHTSIKMSQIPDDPTVTFEIVYRTDAASSVTPLTERYTYYSLASANAIIRRVSEMREGGARADDFDGFAINTKNNGEMEVYNSEELWWAVEHGYKPIFNTDTKAKLFYERAKMILREIITDEMTEYEKVLSIYEYLVEAVSYDYDAYYSGAGKEDVCYYLEGVFEYGRAVCDGKTKAFVLLCGIEGIECVRAFGDSLDGGSGHAWNYVRVGEGWYLVDTTEGDVKYEGGEIEKFLGAKVQIVGYDEILKPTYNHKAKYTYTEMWEDISSSAYRETDYYAARLGESEYDFTLNSNAELDFMIGALYEYGAPDGFVLAFIPDSKEMIWNYFKKAEEKYGFEKKIFNVKYDFGEVYLAFCVRTN